MSILNALKGIGGEYEVQRVIGAFGSIVFIVSAPILVAFGKLTSSMEAFCLTYPAGIAACIGATAGAIALKDRNVATAKVIQDTGAVPVAPPLGPQVQPKDVKP